MRRGIELYLNVHLYRRFSSICKTLGVKVCDILEAFMRDFIEKHKDQVPLDYYLTEKGAKPQVINFHFTQNYNIILAKIAKLDPQKWLDELESLDLDRLDHRQTTFWKERLSELILEANKMLEEIRLAGYHEEEYAEKLQQLLQKAAEILQKLLKKKSRRELIHA